MQPDPAHNPTPAHPLQQTPAAPEPPPQMYGPQPARKRTLWPWIVGGVVLFVSLIAVGVVGGLTLAAGDNDEPPAQATGERASVGSACSAHGATATGVNGIALRCEGGRWISAEAAPAEPAAAPDPAIGDFELSIRITDKQCFGSAGCNVTFKVELASSVSPDPSVTYELTYEVTGIEDGPLVGTLEITGDQYTVQEESVQTKTNKSKIKIRATGISKLGV